MAEIIEETDEFTVVRTEYPGGYMDEVVPKPGSPLEAARLVEQERTAAGTRALAAYQTLKAWADEQAALDAAWPTLTNAQKDAAHRQLQGRFGRLADGVADLLHFLDDR